MAAANASATASGGVGIFGLLGLLFVALKLLGFINWSWWWVLLPFYGPFALVLAIALVCFIIWLIAKAFAKR